MAESALANERLAKIAGKKSNVGGRMTDFLDPPFNQSLRFCFERGEEIRQQVCWRGQSRENPVLLKGVKSSSYWMICWGELSHLPEDEIRQRFEKSAPLITLGQMAGSIAHEINNPLTILLWQVEQLKLMSDKGEMNSEKIGKLTSQLEKTVFRIAKIVKTLKASLSGQRPQKLEKIDIGQLSEEIFEMSQSRLKGMDVEWKNQRWIGPLWVWALPTALTQVILNLLSNSCDALESSSEKRWIEIQFAERGEWVDVIFTDSGKGLPSAIKEKMFEPFLTTKPPGKGTGLGLGLCRKYMEDQDGEFKYNSANSNTQFILSLRRAS